MTQVPATATPTIAPVSRANLQSLVTPGSSEVDVDMAPLRWEVSVVEMVLVDKTAGIFVGTIGDKELVRDGSGVGSCWIGLSTFEELKYRQSESGVENCLVAAYLEEAGVLLKGKRVDVEGTGKVLLAETMKVTDDNADNECTDELGIVSDDSGEDEIGFVMLGDVGKIVVSEILIIEWDGSSGDISVFDNEMNVSAEDGVIPGVDGDMDVVVEIDVKSVSRGSGDSDIVVKTEAMENRSGEMVVSGVGGFDAPVVVEAQNEDAVAQSSDSG
ncbi:hypothetical protein C0989_002257 [Termitomyces sp. Mn162]|nr:hypothetical protein C0989_002257 [Termitomyces sp. Mn162]